MLRSELARALGKHSLPQDTRERLLDDLTGAIESWLRAPATSQVVYQALTEPEGRLMANIMQALIADVRRTTPHEW